jgi:hypothetical protein
MAAPGNFPEAADITSRIEAVLDGDTPAAPAVETPPKDQSDTPAASSPAEDAEAEPGAEDAASEEEPTEEEPTEEPTEEPIEAPGEEEEGEDALYTIEGLAKALEVDESVFLQHVTIDGPEGKVPLSQVLSTYRSAPEAVRQFQELGNQRAQLDTDRAQLQNDRAQGLQNLHTMAEILHREIESEFADIDWKQLEQDDSQQYVLMRQKHQEKRDKIKLAIDTLNQEAGKHQQEQIRARDEFRVNEVKHLQSKIPDWREPAVARKAMDQVEQFLRSSGFNEQEIAELEDHRMVLVAFQASEFHRMKSQTPMKVKKLRSLPKPNMKGSSARPDDVSESVRAQKAAQKGYDRLRSSGDVRDAASLIEEFGGLD